MRYVASVVLLIALIVGSGLMGVPVSAQQSLRVQPLEYRTTLASGETKKGFIDITNPGSEDLQVTLSTQAFRQIDDAGTLQFFDNEQVSEGVVLDYDEFELKSNETIRLFFLVNGSKLPSGDVFAAIFATGQTTDKSGNVQQALRVGTLLNIVNGTPGPREADIMNLALPFIQIGDTLRGEYVIKNRAEEGQATGFYPTVALTIDPWRTEQQLESRLVYAGRSRTNDFAVSNDRLGFYRVTLSYQNSTTSQWVFMATGPWLGRLVAVILLFAAVIIGFIVRRHRHRERVGRRAKTKYE